MVIHIFQLKLYNGNMEIKTSDKYCILTPMSPTLDGYESLRLFDEISEHQNLNVGLDLSYVQECTIDFLEMLRKEYEDRACWKLRIYCRISAGSDEK